MSIKIHFNNNNNNHWNYRLTQMYIYFEVNKGSLFVTKSKYCLNRPSKQTEPTMMMISESHSDDIIGHNTNQHTWQNSSTWYEYLFKRKTYHSKQKNNNLTECTVIILLVFPASVWWASVKIFHAHKHRHAQ